MSVGYHDSGGVHGDAMRALIVMPLLAAADLAADADQGPDKLFKEGQEAPRREEVCGFFAC